ncbi:hypothetical protein DUNSADRAFT_8542 [Dunaliella salina]|uniref:Uncharacterized protein n=1 Tax=Dunaliella salina TaxID=3046 RepID=A0ABQ7FSU5_DUNSA|nr:hypothetical protein DUNSADRAFT_8542 [Dunaliella salina]|eukprot:KAF5825568.1 hypothetical protein DUNSADRAFT_8542 [Dunaliella salina]
MEHNETAASAIFRHNSEEARQQYHMRFRARDVLKQKIEQQLNYMEESFLSGYFPSVKDIALLRCLPVLQAFQNYHAHKPSQLLPWHTQNRQHQHVNAVQPLPLIILSAVYFLWVCLVLHFCICGLFVLRRKRKGVKRHKACKENLADA